MTGFGSAEKDGFKVEVRSLNHKYIDIAVRIPSALMEHDIPVRNRIKESFSRGKFDVTISLTDKRRLKVSVNKELASGMYDAFTDMQRELSVPGTLDIGFFSGYRELLLTEEPEYSIDALFEAFDQALLRVGEMRRTEGETLKKELLSRLQKLEGIHAEIEALSEDLSYDYKGKLLKRIAELGDMQVDDARLAQEVALIAQKSDITEEITRFKSHIGQFYSMLTSPDIIGRRLDFLLQEMNREANTIGSKVDDVRVINLTIEIKTEMERLREQVQNIQ